MNADPTKMNHPHRATHRNVLDVVRTDCGRRERQACLVIAEAGVNHNGDVGLAHRLIDAAVECGADAVKFQAFRTESLVGAGAVKADYQVATTGAGTQADMLAALELSAANHYALMSHCRELGVDYLCTPYDPASVDMLMELGVDAFKVASADITNTLLLRRIASAGRPVLLATGMASLGEVEHGVDCLRQVEAALPIVLLHCTTEYPADPHQANLLVIPALREAFGLTVGLSDHTPGIALASPAVALGACLIEKHFTLDKSMEGPDHRASLEPDELRALVVAVRETEAALGDGHKSVTPGEERNAAAMRRSLVTVRALVRGETVRAEDLDARRPATGLSPSWVDEVSGRHAARDLAAGSVLGLSDIDWSDAVAGRGWSGRDV